MTELIANDYSTTLTASITTSSTTLAVAAALPTALQGTGSFRLLVSSSSASEYMIGEMGDSDTTITVTRGAEGTAAHAFASGSTVLQVLTVGGLEAVITETAPAPSSATPEMDGSAAHGSSAAYSRGDHVHPTDTSLAPLDSPHFTGVPTVPTAATDTDTTQAASCAMVQAAVTAGGGGGGATVDEQALGDLGATPTLTLTELFTQVTGTLSANCTLTVAGLADGCSVALLLLQDSTGGRTLTISNGSNSAAVVIPSAPSAAVAVQLWSPDGSTIYAMPGPQTAPLVVTVASGATPTWPVSGPVTIIETASLAVAITGVTVSGTPLDGWIIKWRVKDNGTARGITLGSSFQASGSVALPSTTVISKQMTYAFEYYASASKWVLLAADAGF